MSTEKLLEIIPKELHQQLKTEVLEMIENEKKAEAEQNKDKPSAMMQDYLNERKNVEESRARFAEMMAEKSKKQ